VANICPKHQGYDPRCDLCNTPIEAIVPDIAARRARAQRIGARVCHGCGFVYYATGGRCPKCNRVALKEDEGR
jgi:hypothetical protein